MLQLSVAGYSATSDETRSKKTCSISIVVPVTQAVGLSCKISKDLYIVAEGGATIFADEDHRGYAILGIKYFLGNSFNITAGADRATYEEKTLTRPIVVVGNHWSFESGFFHGVDWIGGTFNSNLKSDQEGTDWAFLTHLFSYRLGYEF